MNGFEFSKEALSITAYELDKIVAITDASEVDWLEFKAAIKAQNSEEDEKANDADFILHLLKALIGMANGIGGMVVLGIDDNGQAVGLGPSGFDGDKDKFTLALSEIFFREGWRTKLSGHWRWKNQIDKNRFNPEWAKYRGVDVLVFAVKPRERDHGPLVVTNSKSKNNKLEEIVFMRLGGDRGRVEKITPDEAESWWKEGRDPYISSMKFKKWILQLEQTDPETYCEAVRAYSESVVKDSDELAHRYVSLEADAWKGRANKPKRTAQDDFSNDEEKSSSRNEWRGDFEEMISDLFPAFVIGEPGAGKSTCFSKIAREEAIGNIVEPEKWSLLVRLSSYTADGLKELICREIPPLKWPDLVLALRSGQLILLLDGFNECPIVYTQQCTTDLKDLLEEHSASKIFISTRATHLPRFAEKTITLRAMSTDRQQKFVERYLDETNELDAVGLFWNALTEKVTAKLIARSPILLRMAVLVWESTKSLPTGLAELYSDFFDAWIQREAGKNFDAEGSLIWSEAQTREALALLSYSMKSDGVVACSRQSAEARLHPLLHDKSGQFIDRVAQGLMVETTKDQQTIRFSHETIQDFLVAVFITNHTEHQLIRSSVGSDNRRWQMPIVFAFELFQNPPEEFLQTAWSLVPILVCAALRDDERLKRLPEPKNQYPGEPQNDSWVRGLIRSIRGEGVTDETASLALLGRTPSPGRYFQKHPLPEELTSALEGVAFWYALNSHESGRYRIERLQNLIIDRRNLWLELLPHVLVAQPDWMDQLTDAQKLLVGQLENEYREHALDAASISELSYMVRNRIITDSEFKQHWKRALNVENYVPLDLEIVVLLATKKIKPTELNGVQRNLLKGIGGNLELSPNILKVLVQNRIVSTDSVRQNPAQIRRLVKSVSPIRAMQLVKSGVLRREDFGVIQIESLLERIESEKDITFLLDAGIIQNRQSIPPRIRDRVHSQSAKRHSESKVSRSIINTIGLEFIPSVEDILAPIFMMEEQILLKKIQENVLDPNNFPLSNGYHRTLVGYVESSQGWPKAERKKLIDLAELFFKKHGSKKRHKEYRDLIRAAKDSMVD